MRQHNKYKTHCPHGHEYSAENTRLVEGKRHCIACHRQRNRECYYRRQEREVPPTLTAVLQDIANYAASAVDTSHDLSSSYSTDTTSSDTGGGGDFGGGGASGDY